MLLHCDRILQLRRFLIHVSSSNRSSYCSITRNKRKLHVSSTQISDDANDAASSSSSFASIVSQIPLSDIRNFCFIAHVDHGKSSLASRLLERLGNFSITSESYFRTSYESLQNGASAAKENYLKLDTLNVEKERGITVKASAATMLYKPMDGSILSESNTTGYLLLNMVDTPGHVDFGLEVTRSLYAVQGAVLLFDAAQGIQAQSLNVYHKAKVANTVLLPALTKIDLPSAKPLEVSISIADMFKDFDPDLIVHTSARSNIGIDSMLEAVSKEVPAPEIFDDDDGTTFRAQVIDSWFEPLRGVVCLLNIISGTLNEGDRMAVIRSSFYRDKSSSIPKLPKESIFSVQDVGVVLPHRVRTQILSCGQMGYAVIGLRDPRMARPGSMIIAQKDINKIASMRYPSWISLSDDVSRSVLFASVHPMDADEFDELCTAIDKLALNDTGIEVHRTGGASSSDGGPFLGPGLRIGFQGLLHVEVFRQRLSDEYGMDAIVTPPKVPYLIRYLPSKHSRRDPEAPNEEIIEDLSKWPASGERFDVLEPIVKVKVIAPVEYAGNVMELIKRKRGENMVTEPIDDQSWIFSAAMPWGDVVTDFHDSLKNCTAGYASFDTEEAGYKQGDLCRIEIMLNGESVEPLTFVSHRNTAYAEGRAVCSRLKETLPREQFVIKIQAKTEGKIIAGEQIKAYRKDVLTTGGSKSVGGGDITRKKKLLEKQKRGKKRLASYSSGKVRLSQEAFNSVISRSS